MLDRDKGKISRREFLTGVGVVAAAGILKRYVIDGSKIGVPLVEAEAPKLGPDIISPKYNLQDPIPVGEVWENWKNERTPEELLFRATGGYEKQISWEELAASISGKKGVLIGEDHTQTEEQIIARQLVEAMYKNNPRIVIAVERFSQSQQDALDRFVNEEGNDEITLQRLLKITQYAERDWGNYGDENTQREYFKILLFARRNKIPLIGLDLDQEKQNEIWEKNLGGTDEGMDINKALNAVQIKREERWYEVLSTLEAPWVVVTGGSHVSNNGPDSLYGRLKAKQDIVAVKQPALMDTVWPQLLFKEQGLWILKNPKHSGHTERVVWSEAEEGFWRPQYTQGPADFLVLAKG